MAERRANGGGPGAGGAEPCAEVVDPSVRCEECPAACCRKQVLLFGDAGVPPHLTVIADWGGDVMARLGDGWCAALDRGSLRCGIYPRRPQVCRDVVMGGAECLAARAEAADAPGTDG